MALFFASAASALADCAALRSCCALLLLPSTFIVGAGVLVIPCFPSSAVIPNALFNAPVTGSAGVSLIICVDDERGASVDSAAKNGFGDAGG